MCSFQSTRPVRGATLPLSRLLHGDPISIHAPRAGRDSRSARTRWQKVDFNPRAPCGARPRPFRPSFLRWFHFNPRAPCGARPAGAQRKTAKRCISIHAPRAGRDDVPQRGDPGYRHFNPRAPCGARRLFLAVRLMGGEFQSTRPVRGATPALSRTTVDKLISIHAPRAGRDSVMRSSPIFLIISIHAPRAGRDGGAVFFTPGVQISIHAPRAGRDSRPLTVPWSAWNFNPRAPCGARRMYSAPISLCTYFNPRAPCGARHCF